MTPLTTRAATSQEEIHAALHTARELVRAGVPVFTASPAVDPQTGHWDPRGGSGGSGYVFPPRWQATEPEEAAVDAWRPGDALCLVTGAGVDVLDVDPRNGGADSLDELTEAGTWPRRYGRALTPSGGLHDFVAPLDVRKVTDLRPGLDVLSGVRAAAPAEAGRGFVFLAPTVKLSKTSGDLAGYRWLEPLEVGRLAVQGGADDSGRPLVELIATKRAERPGPRLPEAPTYAGPPYDELEAQKRDAVDRWMRGTLVGIAAELDAAAEWGPTDRDARGRGWEKLTADAALRLGQLARATWNPLTLEGAEEWFLEHAPTDETWTRDHTEEKWRLQAHRRDPAPWPANLGLSAADRQAQAFAAFGLPLPEVPNAGATPGAWSSGTAPEGPQVVRGAPDEDTDVEVLAERFLRGRYCWSLGLGWLRYKRGAWVAVSEDHVQTVVLRSMRPFVASQLEGGVEKARMSQLNRYLKIATAEKFTRACRGILEVAAERFDAHPDLLNVANGVVDLRTGELLPHDPELLLTKRSAVSYEPGAVSADWAAALEAVPEDLRGWLQIRLGQAVTGHPTSDDILPVLQGGGSNGKTTVLGAVVKALGDHAVTVPEKLLLANPSDHPTELTTLRGARLALVEELPEGRRLNIKRLKDVLGTPQLTARMIRKDNITWAATHSLMVTTNYAPVVEESDHGTWRRLALCVFPYRYVEPGEETSGPMDRPAVLGLRERLRDGGNGQHEAVLAWVIAGAVRWYAAGKVIGAMPASVRAETRKWRHDTDLILAYCDERLAFDPDAHVMSTELFADFGDFLAQKQHRPWAEKTFASRFGSHDATQEHRVARKQVRAGAGLSRRVAVGMPQEPARAKYVAWLGVRFRTENDDRAEILKQGLTSANTGPVHGVQGESGVPRAGAYLRGLTE